MRVKLSCPPLYKDEKKDVYITHVSTDTRELEPFDLFFPIKGEHEDGNAHIIDALTRGALISRTSLCDFARQYKNRLENLKHSVAITGSVGKTTTKEFLKVILKEKFKVHATLGNQNNNIGLPLTVLSAPKDTEILILEMGMNHKGEISELSKCARPDVGIITNVGSAHIGNLGSREAIAEAKLEILDGMSDGTLIIPHSEPLLAKNKSALTFSTDSKSSHCYIKRNDTKNVEIFLDESRFCSAPFDLKGEHFLKNLAAACTAAISLGVSESELCSGISKINEESVRHRIIKANAFYILDDCYNASLESVKAAIALSKELDFQKKSLVLGSIGELGSYSEEIHEEVGRLIDSLSFENLYLFGECAEYIRRGALSVEFPESRIFVNKNPDDPHTTAKEILRRTEKGELILFKGSRKVRLERIIEILTK